MSTSRGVSVLKPSSVRGNRPIKTYTYSCTEALSIWLAGWLAHVPQWTQMTSRHRNVHNFAQLHYSVKWKILLIKKANEMSGICNRACS